MNRSSTIAVKLIALLLSVLTSLFVVWLMKDITFRAYSVVIGVAVLISIIVLVGRRRIDVFEPIFLFMGMALLSFYVRAYGLQKGDVTSYMESFLSWASPLGYDKAMVVVVLGILSLYLGYSIPTGVRLQSAKVRPAVTVSRYRLAVFVFCAFVFSAACLSVIIVSLDQPIWVAIGDRLEAFKGMGYLVLGVQASAIVCTTAVVLSWMLRFNVSRQLYVMLFLSLLLILPLGSRAPVVNVLLIMAAGWYYFRPARYKLTKLVLLGVALVVLLNVYADVRGGDRLSTGLITADMKCLVKRWVFLDLGRRTPEFDALTLIVADYPHLPLQYGKTYLSILTAPIPSGIFPSKFEGGSVLFNNHFLPQIYQEGLGAGIRPSILGEFFMNFSYFGVMIGMFLVGAAMKAMYSWFVKVKSSPGNSPARIVLYVILTIHIPQLVRGEFCGTMISVLYFSFVSMVTLRIIRERVWTK